MLSALGYLIELLGFACLVFAASLVSDALMWAVVGAGLIVGAQAARR